MAENAPPLKAGRSFALLWISQALSALGTSVSSLAYPLLLLDATGSALAAGLVATTAAIVGLTARIPGGMLADRHRSKPLMLASDAARSAAVAGVAAAVLMGDVWVPFVLFAVAVEVACGAAFGPAEFTLVRLLVPADQRAIAVGRMQSRSQLAGLVGPVLGGALYGVSPALPFLADAASYAVSFLLVAAVKAPARASSADAGRHGFGAWRWLRAHPFLFTGGVWVAMLTATFGAVGLTILVVARDRGASPAEIGVIYAMSAAGGLLGSLFTPTLQRRIRSVAIFRAAAVLDLAATLALPVAPTPFAIGAAGAVAFFLAPTVAASLFGRLSADCPDHLVGRAQASLTLIIGTAAPLAPLAIGVVLDRWGPTIGIAATATSFAVLAAAAFALPAFRADRR